MARPRFSEMLFDRRRQLGLSIAQASHVLRLKPQVLQAFEEGDFPSIPKSGYAQGMLSSYARYLGLNTRVIVSQFTQDLEDFEQGGAVGSYAHSAQTGRIPAGTRDSSNVRVRGSRERYYGRSGLLPTSGGYAGDMHDFATTSRVHLRDSGDFVPENNQRLSSTRPRPQMRQRGSRFDSSYDGDTVFTRTISSGEYTDDLRYDDARPFDAASSASGRRRSRNIASAERPRVMRQEARGNLRARGARPRGAQKRPRGIVQALWLWLQEDTRRLAFALALLCALVLTVVIIASVTACINNTLSTPKQVQVAAADSSQNTKPSQDTVSSSEADAAADAAAEEKAAKDAEEAKNKTEVEVSVQDGEVSWVEVVCDGKSDIAQQVTGPWSKTYTVVDSITIQVSNPSVVKVVKNGTQTKFDTKTAGIGTVTIKGTKPEDTNDASQDGDGTSSDKNGKQTSKSKASGSKKNDDKNDRSSKKSDGKQAGSKKSKA